MYAISINKLFVMCYFIIALVEIYNVNCAESSNNEHYIDEGYNLDNIKKEVKTTFINFITYNIHHRFLINRLK